MIKSQTMNKALLKYVFYVLLSINFGFAQLIVDNQSASPLDLVVNELVGNGVSVSNVTFNGSPAYANAPLDQIAFFDQGSTTNLGLNKGLIVATGDATVAVGPNNESGASDYPSVHIEGDPDLAQLTSFDVRRVSLLEFDFVPMGQEVSFNFIFASEEYPEFETFYILL